MQGGNGEAFSRRDLLSLIGTVAGSTAMYHAMTSLGFAADSAYQGPIDLSINSIDDSNPGRPKVKPSTLQAVEQK